MIIKVTFFTFAYKHVRHIKPNWTCSPARFTLVANRSSQNHYFQNQTEPGPVKITPLMTYYNHMSTATHCVPPTDDGNCCEKRPHCHPMYCV